jgi:hypothetical protein
MQNIIASLTTPAQTEPDSGIVTAAMYGMGKSDVMAFWSGQGNLPTPEAFCRPAIESLMAGETFLHLAARHSGIARSPGALSCQAL